MTLKRKRQEGEPEVKAEPDRKILIAVDLSVIRHPVPVFG